MQIMRERLAEPWEPKRAVYDYLMQQLWWRDQPVRVTIEPPTHKHYGPSLRVYPDHLSSFYLARTNHCDICSVAVSYDEIAVFPGLAIARSNHYQVELAHPQALELVLRDLIDCLELYARWQGVNL